MFPYTVPARADEVIAFMEALGAETTYQEAEVRNSHAWGVDEIEESYSFRMGTDNMGSAAYMAPFFFEPHRMNRLADDLFHVQWITTLGEDMRFVIPPESWGDQLKTGGDYAILNAFANMLEQQGFRRDLTAVTLTIWHAIRAQPLSAPGMRGGLALFTRCAKIARRTDLSGEQQVDVALRDIPLAALDTLLGQHIQYSLIAEMYPYPAAAVLA